MTTPEDGGPDPVAMAMADLEEAPLLEAEPWPGELPADRAPDSPTPEGARSTPPNPILAGVFPPACPIAPLGKSQDVFYFIDADGQLMELKSGEFSKNRLLALYGNYTGWLHANFPHVGRKDRWDGEKATEAHMRACSREGLWDPFERCRGPGGWRGENGSLVVHCGTRIFEAVPGQPGLNQWHPGRIGSFVYPASPGRPYPSDRTGGDAGESVLELLRTWTWNRPTLDPVLMMGWLGAALLGGALKWRPMAWITGDSKTGKSTLQDFISGLFGNSIVSVGNVTAASIWQSLGYSSAPIAVDEMEPEPGSNRGQAIVRLARDAASGQVLLRGGADHKAVHFFARSAFLFSSIYIQSLSAQDQNRMAILELQPRPTSTTGTGLQLDAKQTAQWGSDLQRILLDQWHRFDRTLEVYGERMAQQGHGQRAIDQFATLLACWDMLTKTDAPTPEALNGDDEVRDIFEQLAPGRLAEISHQDESWQIFLNTLLSKTIDFWKAGRRVTVGTLIQWAAGTLEPPSLEDRDNAIYSLGEHGIRVEMDLAHKPRPKRWVYIANRHAGLRSLMQNEIWGASSGGAAVWIQAVRRIPGAERVQETWRFAGANSKCSRFPLAAITEDTE